MDHYRAMAADRGRIDAYYAALQQCVDADTVVVDIGTGTGTFALIAARLGARRVYAIEPADIIYLAQDLAEANRLSERIVFIQDRSTSVELQERADVIVSDLRGVLPWFDGHTPAIIDARQRLLAPGGVLIPECDTLYAAPVAADDLYRATVAPWDQPWFGLDFSTALDTATDAWFKARVRLDHLLAHPQELAMLNYQHTSDARLSAEASWAVDNPAQVHGFAVWFDTVLIDGIGFSNAPGQPEHIYGCGFFPLKRPATVAQNDRITLRLRADPAGDGYLWRWEATILEAQTGRVKAAFDQSNFAERRRAASALRGGFGLPTP